MTSVVHQLDSTCGAHACLQTALSGAFDGSLERLLPIIEADLFSDLADAKEAAPFAGNFR